MKVTKTNFEGLLIIEPVVWGDDRGYFFESFNENVFADNGITNTWIQDNEALSERGVLRGLHYQTASHGQAKLVRVAQGEVLDVVVDIRKDSSTYGETFSVILSGTNKKQLLVPRGFAHGYIVLSQTALFLYKVDNVYNAQAEAGIRYNDADLNIDWILSPEEFKLSQKDQKNQPFSDHVPY